MRHFLVFVAFIVCLSSFSGQCLAAGITTYAHVTLVPGADATLNTQPGSSNGQFALSGSGVSRTSFQFSAANIDSESILTNYDDLGVLSFEFPITANNTNSSESSDQLISIVFE